MRRHVSGRRFRLVLWLCAAGLLAAAARAQTGSALSGEALVAALREGGYNIYFRHTATDWGQQDRVGAAGDWTSCDPARMRQLSAEGREMARRIGAAIRKLGLPVGRVLASEYCRAADTAREMELGPVRTTREIMNLRAAGYLGGHEAVTERARAQLAAPPAPGTNTVLVAHGNLMRAATGHYTGEGGAVVVKPRAGGGFDVVAELMPADWSALAMRHGGGA